VRYEWWVKSLKRSALNFDQILIIDDGSNVFPDWPDMEIINECDAPDPGVIYSSAPIVLYHFNQNLGRKDLLNFPGWHRSFAFGALYGFKRGFEKIIHLESDAYLTSWTIQDYFNTLSEGWVALWSEKYQMPEMAIQVISGSSILDLVEFVRKPYAEMIGRVHEYIPPYTHIDCQFQGDRYGEHLNHIPNNSDYATQVHQAREREYYWWINDGEEPSMRRNLSNNLNKYSLRVFSLGVDGAEYERGWSYPERGYRWAIGFDSRIILPPLDQKFYLLEFDAIPFTHSRCESQRVIIIINNIVIGEFKILRISKILCKIRREFICNDRENIIRILHPDAQSPLSNEISGDGRVISISVANFHMSCSND
jgi:hypothetical protein